MSTLNAKAKTSRWNFAKLRENLTQFGAEISAAYNAEAAPPQPPVPKQKLVAKLYMLTLSHKILTSVQFGTSKNRLVVKGRSMLEKTFNDKTVATNPGDLVVSLNGIPVSTISPSNFLQFPKKRQHEPVHIVFATMVPKEVAAAVEASSSGDAPEIVGLRSRLQEYYREFNRTKVAKVGTIIRLYAGRENILAGEMAAKYQRHIEGDPSWRALTDYCPSISASEIVVELCRKNRIDVNFTTSSSESILSHLPLILIDCRKDETVKATGHFTVFRVPLRQLLSKTGSAEIEKKFAPLKGIARLCIVSHGDDELLNLYDPQRAAAIRAVEADTVNACALFLLRRGYPYVCFARRGFVGCYRFACQCGVPWEDLVINKNIESNWEERMRQYPKFESLMQRNPTAASNFSCHCCKEFGQRINVGAEPGTAELETGHVNIS